MLALLALPALAEGPVTPTADDPEAVYARRLATFLKDPGNFPYSPMERLDGAHAWKPMQTVPAQRRTITSEALAAAEAYAISMKSSAFMVWHDGKLEATAFGNGAGPRTLLNSKSLAKPLTAIAVGRAIALGKIASLDQSIADFIPELKGTPKAAIRLRYLLDMRSGMLDQGFSPDPNHPLNRAFLDTHHEKQIIATYPLISQPGTRYAYAQAPSDLVGLVVERATGRRWGEFIGTEVLGKIGAPGGELWVNRPGGLAHSGCCTQLPAETFLRMAILLLDDGKWQGKRLLPAGYVAEMRKGTPQNPSFGLSLWIGEPYRQRRGFGAPGTAGPQVLHSEPYADPDLFLFDGNSNQTVQISPRNRLIVLRMGPTPPAPSADRPEWDNAFLPNTLIRGIRPSARR